MDPMPPPASPPATVARPQHQHQHQHQLPLQHTTPHPAFSHQYDEKASRDHRHDHHTSKPTPARAHDSVISSQPLSPRQSSPPSPSSSSISSGRKHRSVQQPPHHHHPNVAYPPRAHLASDPEKAASHPPRSNPDVAPVLYDSDEYHEKGPEEKIIQLLFYLSGPCALLSLAITLWTVCALFVALLLLPLRLVSKQRPRLADQLKTFLAPALNLQLHLVYSYSAATDYSPSMLVVIHLFSPLVAAGVAVAAWVAAFFAFFSAILGDPAGQDGHNDGKDSILGVRSWWDRWLSRGLR